MYVHAFQLLFVFPFFWPPPDTIDLIYAMIYYTGAFLSFEISFLTDVQF